jgi:hypothetical protein
MIPRSEFGEPLERIALHRFGLVIDRSDDAVRDYRTLVSMVDPNTTVHHVTPDVAARYTCFRKYEFVLVENNGLFKDSFPGLDVVDKILPNVHKSRIVYVSGYPDSSRLQEELCSRNVRHWQRGKWSDLKQMLTELLEFARSECGSELVNH